MDEINSIATAHRLVVIEDAAQSFGALYKGRQSCGLSAIGCTSFFPSKPLGCYGDGGALFTADPDLAKIMRQVRVHGQERRYYHTRVGVGGRMDTIQCAIVLAKMEFLQEELRLRAVAGRRYLDGLSNNASPTLPAIRPDRTCVWAQFTLQLENRDQVAARLQAEGIPTAVHYPIPLHRQPAYRDICRLADDLGNADLVASRVLSLPIHPYLSAGTQDKIIDAVARAVPR
jgi:UDP-2-acetamido-2-deoxy-ribo-hexuluronate aminotransferase